MYGILMLLTFIVFAGSVAIICAISIDDNKKHLWRLLLFIPIIWASFLFEQTGSIMNYDDVAKTQTKNGTLSTKTKSMPMSQSPQVI